ncbi:hypothetical protein [Silvanigrella sp.]|jgi:hypothetical protein|uniref:hypothetical protein n=1 Tax=Silvanigrella sp. TaxID=2024976 RepID=UPI0037CB51ED
MNLENKEDNSNSTIFKKDLSDNSKEKSSHPCVIEANWKEKAFKVICSTPQLIIISLSAITIFLLKILHTFLHTIHLIKK